MDDIVKPSLTPPKHLGGGYKDNLLPGFPGKPGMTERKKSEDDIRGGGMTGLLFRPLQRKKMRLPDKEEDLQINHSGAGLHQKPRPLSEPECRHI